MPVRLLAFAAAAVSIFRSGRLWPTQPTHGSPRELVVTTIWLEGSLRDDTVCALVNLPSAVAVRAAPIRGPLTRRTQANVARPLATATSPFPYGTAGPEMILSGAAPS